MSRVQYLILEMAGPFITVKEVKGENIVWLYMKI